MNFAVANWHGSTVPFSGFYLHYFLWCICSVADNSKDIVSALKSTIFLVQEKAMTYRCFRPIKILIPCLNHKSNRKTLSKQVLGYMDVNSST